jgi:two-component system, chemotaxis family, CheB/CheR fusion protein
LNDSFLLLLMFMITTAVPSLALSADLSERQRAQDQQQLLLRELSGRVGNTLAVLQSVFRGSVQDAGTIQELKDAFEARLMNLAATHTLLSNNNWRSAQVGDLVRAAVSPYCPNDHDDCEFVGEELRLPASMVLSLTMILHELATNADKHGAFKSNGGKLKVVWQEEEGEVGRRMLRLDWHESDAKNDRQSDYCGYGFSLIATVSALGGDIEREYREDGMSIRLVIPLT